MSPEQVPEMNGSQEDIEAVFRREIKQALSPVFAKSTQELLPGYLPNKPTKELTPEELALYHTAFQIVGDMVQHDEAEVVFESEESESEPLSIAREEFAVMKFKLHVDGGHRAPEKDLSGLGSLSFDEAA